MYVDEGGTNRGTGRSTSAHTSGNRTLSYTGSPGTRGGAISPAPSRRRVSSRANRPLDPVERFLAASPSRSPRPPTEARSFSAAIQDVANALTTAASHPPPFDSEAVRNARTALVQEEIANDQAADAKRHQSPTRYPLRPGLSRFENKENNESTLRIALQDSERALRKEALGDQDPKVQQMTLEKYNSLSTSERAAVDFNTMLVGATRRDAKLEDTYDPSAKERIRYNTTVEDMFGADGGSDKYAPETLAVLKQIDFKDTKSDLDDFISLRSAITKDDIKNNLDTVTGIYTQHDANTPTVDKQQLVQHLSDSTRTMQEALAKGNNILQTMNRTTKMDRQEGVELLGGIPRKLEYGLGFDPNTNIDKQGRPTDLNTYFQIAFNNLGRQRNADNSNTQGIVGDLHNVLRGNELSEFLNYADTRSQNAEDYYSDLSSLRGAKFQTPEHFRKLLKLDSNGASSFLNDLPAPQVKRETPRAQPAQQPQNTGAGGY